MQEKTLTITVYYRLGEREWGKYILDITTEALPVLEELAGFPYPFPYDVVVYPKTGDEMNGWSASNRGKDGIWINRDENIPEKIKKQGFSSTIIHESAHYWAGDVIYEESWLKEGYAELFTLLTLERMGRKEEAADEKENWEYRVKKYQSYDFPLDEWMANSLEPPIKGKTAFAYGKSALFCYSISEKYGIATIQRINSYLYENSMSSDSLEYLGLLEEITKDDQKELFIGWIFSKEIDAGRWREAERKLKELEALRDHTESTLRQEYGVQVYVDVLLSEVKRLIRSFQFEMAIKAANDEIERLNRASSEFEKHLTAYSRAEEYYRSRKIMFEQNIPKKKLLSAYHSLVSLRYETFQDHLEGFYSEMEQLEEYYSELELRYNELKVTDGSILNGIEALISRGSYKEALIEMERVLDLLKECEEVEMEVGEAGLFAKVGMLLLNREKGEYEEDVIHAWEEIREGNLESASQILAQTQEELSRAKKYGMDAVLMGMILVFSFSVMAGKRKKRH